MIPCLTGKGAVATVATISAQRMKKVWFTAIVPLMDTESDMLNALNIGADDGRKTENGTEKGKTMMDKFELAGFDDETCEQLRKISEEPGIDPDTLISFVNLNRTDQKPMSEYEEFTSAWYRFKMALWDEFIQSRIGKFMIRIADKLSAWLER